MGSITDVQAATKPRHDFKTAAMAGFVGGNLSSFVKWGSEIPFPPREAGRISPPFAILKALGLNAEDMTYVFTGHVINYGVALEAVMNLWRVERPV